MFCLCWSLHSSWLITAIVDIGLEIGKQGWALYSVFFFLTLKSQDALTSRGAQSCPVTSPSATAILSPAPHVPHSPTQGRAATSPEGQAGPARLSRQCTPLPAARRPPLPGTPSRGPLTSTQVEGDATFWPPETLSDNSSVQFERLHREVADF